MCVRLLLAILRQILLRDTEIRAYFLLSRDLAYKVLIVYVTNAFEIKIIPINRYS